MLSPYGHGSELCSTGKDSFYVLAPVPHQVATSIGPRKSPNCVLALLKHWIKPCWPKDIRADFAMTPDDFAEDT